MQFVCHFNIYKYLCILAKLFFIILANILQFVVNYLLKDLLIIGFYENTFLKIIKISLTQEVIPMKTGIYILFAPKYYWIPPRTRVNDKLCYYFRN